MTPTETNRICCVCKKLFCCEQCRERHEKEKHTKRQPNCPLCISQKLSLKHIEDKELLSHIVAAHLPLYCCLCGEIFKGGKDLETFGTCKWWNSRHRHSLVSEQKSILGTPPFDSEGKEATQYNGNFNALTSPPELYRNTSTPMILGQKSTFDFKTPKVPNFSLKTPSTNSGSINKGEIYKTVQGSGTSSNDSSKYMSLSSGTDHGQTPFRALPPDMEKKKEVPRSSFRKLDTSKDQTNCNPNERYTDNNCVEDMELTNLGSEMLPDSQSSNYQPEPGLSRRSDSLKKVRFSDQYDSPSEPSSTNNFNMTDNEEYFEACDTLSEMKQSLEQSQIKIYEDNAKNTEKENRTPDTNVSGSQTSTSSRVVMMVVVESNSTVSTSDLIDTGLKKLERFTSNSNLSVNSPNGSSSMTSADSYYSLPSPKNYSSQSESVSSPNASTNTSTSSGNASGNTSGIFSAVANAVRNVMKNFTGVSSSRNIQREPMSSRVDIGPRPSTSQTFPTAPNLSILQRPGKRSRDALEGSPSVPRQVDSVLSQIEVRSPLAKRQRGWYRIKAREPIARMRNNRQITSPRGVSSETQVFHQGSLSVGDTVLPLPDRAHQSTQTE